MQICKHLGCDNPVQNPSRIKPSKNKGRWQIYNRCSKCAGNIKRYGITTPERDEMLVAQGGRCKICSSPIVFDAWDGNQKNAKHKAVVDHCHSHGNIRGILCLACNSMLGYAYDSIDVLRKGAEYLDEQKHEN